LEYYANNPDTGNMIAHKALTNYNASKEE